MAAGLSSVTTRSAVLCDSRTFSRSQPAVASTAGVFLRRTSWKSSRVSFAAAAAKPEDWSAKSIADNAVAEAEKAKDLAGDLTGKAKEGAVEMKDSVKDYAEQKGERSEEASKAASEKVKEGVSSLAEEIDSNNKKALDAAEGLGEKAKEGLSGAWEAAKEAGDKLSGGK